MENDELAAQASDVTVDFDYSTPLRYVLQAMVRFQIENEPTGFDERKASVVKKKRSL